MEESEQAFAQLKNCYQTDSIKAFNIYRRLVRQFPKSPKIKTLAHLAFSQVYEYWGKDPIAQKHTDSALVIAQRHKFRKEEAWACLQNAALGSAFEVILENLQRFETLQLSESITEPDLLFHYHYEFGYYYFLLENYETAKRYFTKALQISREEAMAFETSISLNAMSMVYSGQKNYKMSLHFIDMALQPCQNGNPMECGNNYYQKGLVLYDAGQLEEAQAAILKAKYYYETFHPSYHPSIVEGILGTVYLRQKKYTEAKKNYDVFFQKATFHSTKLWAFRNLYRYYREVKDLKNALTVYEQMNRYKDSLQPNEKVLLLAETRNKFEKQLTEQEQQKTHLLYRFTLVIVLLTLLGVLWVFVLQCKNNRLKNRLAQAEQERLEQQLEFEQRKLATNTLQLSHYNDLLTGIKHQIKQTEVTNTAPLLKNIVKTIDNSLQDANDWEKFKLHFEAVSPQFFDLLKARSSLLTELDLKHCAYLKLNMTPKQVAQLLGVSPKSVTLSRVRIKKKLKLNEDEQLSDFLSDL
ncbi:MAG: hypothetical protein U0X91_05210 [Spirosomataceae bacterium]